MHLRTDWRFDKETSAADLANFLPGGLNLKLSGSTHEQLTIYDDFNGTIWRSGLVLISEGPGTLKLWQDGQQSLITRTPIKGIRFWWQLPAGALAEKLHKLTDIRAFTPQYQCQIATVFLNVLNSDEKIVARIRLYTVNDENSQSMCLASVLPLRGYTEDYSRALKSLSPLNPREIKRLTLRQLLIEAGLQTTKFSSAAVFKLQPEEPSESAVTRMAEVLLSISRQYEPGILADIDTEFVHQYRVNIRKARSVINLFKKSFTQQRYKTLKTDLKVLGSRTNALRDLDVFLLARERYENMLPEPLRPGLSQVFRRIKRRRTTVLKNVVATLSCADYYSQIEQVGQELQQKPEFATKQARAQIKSVVCLEGLRLYHKICNGGKTINSDTPDESIHELRILCKKLRYLLELFGEIFPKNQARQLVRDLKKLQDNLGRFNDYSVQGEFIANIGLRRNVSDEQSTSINGLVAVLYNKQQHERSLVVTHLAQFSAVSVAEEFHQLLSPGLGKDTNQ